MQKHTTVHRAPDMRVALQAFSKDVRGDAFASFRFADAAESYAVFLDPEQVLKLQGEFNEAVEVFRACGALPAEPGGE